MASKRKASAMNAAVAEEPVDPSDELMFLCLGGGNEVGRSCHIIQYKGKTVMVRQTARPRSHAIELMELTIPLSVARCGQSPCVRWTRCAPILRRFRSQHRRRTIDQPVSKCRPTCHNESGRKSKREGRASDCSAWWAWRIAVSTR